MADVYDSAIDINTDWGGDASTGYLPVKGRRVQEFIRGQLRSIGGSLSDKIGSVKYESGVLKFYDEDGGKQLASVSITGTSYTVNVTCNRSGVFNILSDDAYSNITFSATTTATEIGQSQSTQFPEDYSFSIEVDNGNGYVDRTPVNHTFLTGESATVDIKPFVKTGTNRIRIIVAGDSSKQTRTLVVTANVTTLSITCSHTWERAWISGSEYSINHIYFGGNIQKTLHVKIAGTEYTRQFSASQQYISSAYEFVCTDYFPSAGTGVYGVELWMTSDGIETAHHKFNIMCVSSSQTSTAKLTVMNSIVSTAVNFASNDLFEYATYNRTSVTLDMVATVGSTEIVIADGQVMTTLTQTKNTYTTTLTVDTDTSEGLTLGITLDDVEAEVPIDNNNAYMATSGAVFYMQPALRFNTTSDREEIHNTATGAATTTYEADWSNMIWSDNDGWNVDGDGNKTLTIRAGSSLSVPGVKPFTTSSSSSVTVELMVRSQTVADYESPILTFIDTDEYSSTASRGLVIFPTRILVLTSNERRNVYQRVDFREDEITHFAVTLKRNYYGTGRNVCSVYVNGIQNMCFEYSGTSTFGDGSLRVGQQSTDTMLYMVRLYNKALEDNEVFNNYLNAVIDNAEYSKSGLRKDNSIIDSGAVSYDLVKRAGFNCLVYETDSNLPDLAHPETSALRVNVHIEYNDNPEWNVSIKNVPIDSQGTTSMRYYRHNLRNRITEPGTVWEYPNYNGGKTELGKAGYLAGYGLHASVSKITSKKNVASSPQGHKMGATMLYNDLWMLCEDKSAIPANARVALYEYPMMAFQKYSNGSYAYRGLMTIGPDKTDKNTFGYGETTTYPSLMMIEGPNHAPLMTRFLVPWTDEVYYDYANETLSYGGQEAWDADVVSNLSTNKAEQASDIMAIYESEFKPAYDAIYYTSPYIASLTESGHTLAEINADVAGFQSGTTNGYSNELMSFYDSSYRIVYYSVAQQKYVTLPLETHSMLEYLGLSGTPSTTQIVAARKTKFRSTVFTYVSKSEALFHYVFCELLAVTDNFAKNTYWRKFETLENGGKWGFNQDDLDTIFQTDNNGQDTKLFNVEVDDVNSSNGAEIFQGASSAFWKSLRMWCADEISDKYSDVLTALLTLAGTYKVSAGTVRQSVVNVISHYFHSSASKYFPAMGYNSDTIWTYVDIWAMNPDAVYNNVPPLTQVHGDHLQTELAWIAKRVDYIMSKYALGGWTGSADDGLGNLEFTPANAYTLKLKPALDIYPRMSVGGAASGDSARTPAGTVYNMSLPASSNTTIYVKGVNLLSDIGDLHDLVIASRGGSDEIQFGISGARLRKVLCGNDDPSKVTFNATKLAISGPAIETINLKNCTTVKGTIDLTSCTRATDINLSNTNLTTVLPPVGGRVQTLVLPAVQSVLFLHSLNLLDADHLTLPTLSNIESVYINGMASLDALQTVFSIMATTGNKLKYLTLLWSGVSTITNAQQLAFFTEIANNIYDTETGVGYGRVDWNGSQLTNIGEKPDLQGKMDVQTNAYRRDIDSLENTFPNVEFTMTGIVYQWFDDEEVRRISVENFGTDGYVHENTWKTGELSIKTIYKNNTLIESFDELGVISPKVSVTTGANADGKLYNCTALKRVTIPYSEQHSTDAGKFGYMCQNCTSLTDVKFVDMFYTKKANFCKCAFEKCSSLKKIKLPKLTSDSANLFNECTSLVNFTDGTMDKPKASDISDILAGATSLSRTFYNCNKLAITNDATIHADNTTTGSYMFGKCASLESITMSLAKATACDNMLRECTSLKSAYIDCPKSNNLTGMFAGGDTELTTVTINVGTKLNSSGIFNGCTSLVSLSGNLLDGGYMYKCDNMFNGCKSLTSIGDLICSDVSAGDGNCTQCFLGCTALTSVGNVDLSSVSGSGTNTSSFFSGCTSLQTIGDVDFRLSPRCESAFLNCASLSTIGTINLSATTTLYQTFRGCASLQSIEFEYTPSLVTNAANTFYGCSSLVEKEIEVPNATTTLEMFSCCTALTDVSVSCDKSTITKGMFYKCHSLKNVELSGSSSTTCENMFYACRSLESIDLANFNCDKVITTNSMFRFCSKLELDDISFPAATSSEYMFAGSSDGTYTDGRSVVSAGNIDLPAATNAKNLFRSNVCVTTVGNINIPKTTSAEYLFSGCSELVSVGDIYCPVATTVTSMFGTCTKLETVGTVTCTKATNFSSFANNAVSLKNIGGMVGLKSSVSFSNSAELTAQSVHNIISTAAGGTSSAKVTITLNSTAKARWMASEYYTSDAATATSKYIVIA